MSVMCKQNFLCNKVSGAPGKILSDEEIEKIGPLMGELQQKGLIFGGEDFLGKAQAAGKNPPSDNLVGDNLLAEEGDESARRSRRSTRRASGK